jgi:hypothetical protein
MHQLLDDLVDSAAAGGGSVGQGGPLGGGEQLLEQVDKQVPLSYLTLRRRPWQHQRTLG